MSERQIRLPAIRSGDPLILAPGGDAVPWPPRDERLGADAKRALELAQDAAVERASDHVGPVDLLVGVAMEEHGLGAQVLAGLGATADAVRAALDATTGRGEAAIDAADVTLIPHAQRVLDLAMFEARRLAQQAAGTEHLLLALARENETLTRRVLASLGIEADGIVAAVLARVPVPASYRAAENATPHEGPYERFSDDARRVLAFAAAEAARLGHHWVGGEHLVLGLAAAGALTPLGVTFERARERIAAMQPPRQRAVDPASVTFTGAARLIVEVAMHDAGENAVTAAHLLRAIAAHDAIGGYVLRQLGITSAQ